MDRMLDMTTFVKVVDSGGFSAAARALNMSASAVTTHIQAIEDSSAFAFLIGRHVTSVRLKRAKSSMKAVFTFLRKSTTLSEQRRNCNRSRAEPCGSM